MWDYHSGTARSQIFHVVAAISSIHRIDFSFFLFLGIFYYQIQVTSIRKWSQENYHTKPILQLPFAVWGSAAVP